MKIERTKIHSEESRCVPGPPHRRPLRVAGEERGRASAGIATAFRGVHPEKTAVLLENS